MGADEEHLQERSVRRVGKKGEIQLTCRYRAVSGVVVESVHVLPALGAEVKWS